MKIIMLAGKSNTGKTTALNQLYDRLTDKGTRNILEKRKPHGSEAEDFSAIVNYKGKTTAILSVGDVLRDIVNAIIQYAHCDVLVIAYNTRFETKLDKEVNKNKHHCVIRKKAPTDNDGDRVVNEIMKAAK